jgi:hypothetical protein
MEIIAEEVEGYCKMTHLIMAWMAETCCKVKTV